MRAAGLWPTVTRTRSTNLRFGTVEAFVMTEVQSTPLGERLTGDVVARIIEGTREALRAFTSPDGSLDIPIRGHVITATLRRMAGARHVHAGAERRGTGASLERLRVGDAVSQRRDGVTPRVLARTPLSRSGVA